MRDGTALHDLPDLSRDEEEDGVEKEDKDDPLVVAVVDHLLSRLFKKGGRKLIIILDYTDFLPVPCRKKWDFYNQYNADLDPWIRIYIIIIYII